MKIALWMHSREGRRHFLVPGRNEGIGLDFRAAGTLIKKSDGRSSSLGLACDAESDIVGG